MFLLWYVWTNTVDAHLGSEGYGAAGSIANSALLLSWMGKYCSLLVAIPFSVINKPRGSLTFIQAHCTEYVATVGETEAFALARLVVASVAMHPVHTSAVAVVTARQNGNLDLTEKVLVSKACQRKSVSGE